MSVIKEIPDIYVGQYFENHREVAKAINYDITDSRALTLKALGHYCEYHKEGFSGIVIDSIFDTPLPFIDNEYVYEIGDIIHGKYSDFTIVEKQMKMRYGTVGHLSRVYLCRCNDLDHPDIFERTSSEIKKGTNCPICGKRRAKKEDTLYYKRPDILQYLKNPDEAKNYSEHSGKYIKCKCPICGDEKNVTVINLTKHGFSCDNCSDGISYPNKFIRNILQQLSIYYIPEKVFDWSDGCYYDQYLPSFNMIIENHGGQHYVKEGKGYAFSKEVNRDDKKIDKHKKELAFQNGMKYYITLDCSISDVNYIKNSILLSDLPKLLCFSEDDIDWQKANEAGCNSLMQEAWDLWNNGHYVAYISEQLKISDVTAKTYIKKGIECGKCQEKEQYKNHAEIYTKRIFRPIYNVTDNIYFASRLDYEKQFPDFFPEKMRSRQLYVFINQGKTYKGKELKYISHQEFNDIYERSKIDKSLIVYGKPYDLSSIDVKK